MTRPNAAQHFGSAITFLTRVPLPARWQADVAGEGAWDRTVVYFPLVGSLIGLFTGGLIVVGARWWPVAIAVVLALACEALLTGALHEDALADFCDAFGGGQSPADVLRILDDSRIGAFGTLGLVLGVFLRGAALASLPLAMLLPVAVAAATLGRLAMIAAMARLDPVPGRASLAQAPGQSMRRAGMALAALASLPGIAWLAVYDPILVAASILLGVIFITGFTFYTRSRIGGLTGDCLGALCYFAQLIVLLGASARWQAL